MIKVLVDMMVLSTHDAVIEQCKLYRAPPQDPYTYLVPSHFIAGTIHVLIGPITFISMNIEPND